MKDLTWERGELLEGVGARGLCGQASLGDSRCGEESGRAWSWGAEGRGNKGFIWQGCPGARSEGRQLEALPQTLS